MTGRRGILKRKSWTAYLFILPAVALISVFLIYPIGNVFYYSLRNFNMNKPYAEGFAGLNNFIELFTGDKVFYTSLLVSLKWVASEVSLQLAAGLIIALLLDQTFRGRGACRVIIFSPWAVSGVLTSMMWALMFNQNMGVINDLLKRLHLIDRDVAWISGYGTAFGSLLVAELWRGIPFFSIMLLAALQTIPAELYEACDIDGNRWHRFRYITIPFIKDTVVISALLRSVWEFNNVDIIYNLTGGGPVNATTTLNMYITQTAIRDNDFGYGSAMSVTAFLLLALFAMVYLKATRYGKSEA